LHTVHADDRYVKNGWMPDQQSLELGRRELTSFIFDELLQSIRDGYIIVLFDVSNATGTMTLYPAGYTGHVHGCLEFTPSRNSIESVASLYKASRSPVIKSLVQSFFIYISFSSESKTMLLEKLPLELVQHIIGLVVPGREHNDHSKNLTALLSVNKALESEVSSLCLRNLQDVMYGVGWWPRVPFLVRFHMARKIIAIEPAHGKKRSIATYMHAVAYYLRQYAMFHDPEETGQLSHIQWLHEIGSVLALRGADCRCGKPAFMHPRCYDLSSVPETAFHVVLLRQHTKLEAMMVLEEGKGIDSVCPYLKVPRKDPLFTRRNALEWACARGLDASVVRLVAVAVEQGRNGESYLPTAAAICAMHTKASKKTLLAFLLDALDAIVRNPRYRYEQLQYCGRILLFKEWTLKVLGSLAQHKRIHGISVLRKKYPYLEGSVTSVLPKEFRWEPVKAFMECERLRCNFRRWDEDENRKHWTRCRKYQCRNRYNKAGPWNNVCKKTYYPHRDLWDRKCEKQHPPNDSLYDWNGWPEELSATSSRTSAEEDDRRQTAAVGM
jgi:hypothetical protein